MTSEEEEIYEKMSLEKRKEYSENQPDDDLCPVLYSLMMRILAVTILSRFILHLFYRTESLAEVFAMLQRTGRCNRSMPYHSISLLHHMLITINR